MNRKFEWLATTYQSPRQSQTCDIESHVLVVRRAGARKYVAGIDGLNMDKPFRTMKGAKLAVQNYFEQKFKSCRHENYRIAASRNTLTRYHCNDCGHEWEIDSSGN